MGIVAQASNPSTQEAEKGECLSLKPAWSRDLVLGQSELYRETLSHKNKKEKKNHTGLGCSLVVERLPSMHEALESSSTTTQIHDTNTQTDTDTQIQTHTEQGNFHPTKPVIYLVMNH